MKDVIGSVCVKAECVGTEYTCACQLCDVKENIRGMIFDLTPLYDEATEERLA